MAHLNKHGVPVCTPCEQGKCPSAHESGHDSDCECDCIFASLDICEADYLAEHGNLS